MATEEFYINNRRRLSWAPETGNYGDGGDMVNDGEIIGLNFTFEPGEWSRGWAEIINNGSDSRQIADWVDGIKDFPFITKFNPVDWKFMRYGFDVVDAGAGPYTHTFTEGNCLNTFEFENVVQATTPSAQRLLGGYINSTTITWSKQTSPNDGFVEVSLDVNAQKLDASFTTPTTLTPITAKPFRAHQALWTLEGSAVTEVNSGEIIIEQSLDANDYTYASASFNKFRGAPIPKTMRITGTMNINVKDESIKDLFTADNVLTGTNTLLIERAVDDNIVFNFDKIVITKAIDDGADIEGVVTMDVIFSATVSTIVATDNIATY